MLIRQMLWAPRPMPVSVLERSSSRHLHSKTRLLFLGRLRLLPVLSMGATAYFAYLTVRDGWRTRVLSELRHIMAAADLDSTYWVTDWFMRKGCLIVYVKKRIRKTRTQTDSLSKKANACIRRMRARLR